MTCLCHGVLVENEASLQRIQRRNKMWRNGGTIYLTFVFINQDNELTVKIRKCNNVAPAMRIRNSWIWEWVLKKCNDSDAEDNLVINLYLKKK